MKIGIMSDSHDHLSYIQRAIHVFIENKVDKIVHCGDMVAPFIKRAMGELDHAKNIEVIGIYGNNDGERAGMRKILKGVMEIKGDFYQTEWDGLKVAVYHGTENPLLEGLIHSRKYHLVLCGHTHQLRTELINDTLVINPGETCGYLTENATCVLLDLSPQPLTLQNLKVIKLN